MLPFLEQHALADEINATGMAVVPWDTQFQPWKVQPVVFLCPSSQRHIAHSDGYGRKFTNYHFCAGDSPDTETPLPRGVFGLLSYTRIDDVRDGTSHTIAMAERAFPSQETDIYHTGIGIEPDTPRECYATYSSVSGYPVPRFWSGRYWSDGGSAMQAVNTCLPPNQPQCAKNSHNAQPGYYTISSKHPGGAQAVMVDGSVRFMSEMIDAGNQEASSVTNGPSPYGVWGCLGSKAGGEVTREE